MTIETECSGKTAGNQAVRQVSGPSRRPSGTSLGGGRANGPTGAWGPRPPENLGARAPERLDPGLSHDQFFVVLKSLLVGGWRRGGSQLKRLPQMWGPGGKRARDTPPTPPHPLLACKGERKRVFTLRY